MFALSNICCMGCVMAEERIYQPWDEDRIKPVEGSNYKFWRGSEPGKYFYSIGSIYGGETTAATLVDRFHAAVRLDGSSAAPKAETARAEDTRVGSMLDRFRASRRTGPSAESEEPSADSAAPAREESIEIVSNADDKIEEEEALPEDSAEEEYEGQAPETAEYADLQAAPAEDGEHICEPWPSDGIVFVKGDWKIWRAAYEGMYFYAVGGTPGRDAVDAVSLMEWNMATLPTYIALTPWISGLVFKDGDWQIMRDVFAGGANKNRKYYIQTASGVEKVNMYELLARDMATCDASVEKEIESAALSAIKGDDQYRPWPSDKIVFAERAGVTIRRASAEGVYVLKNGSFSRSVNAARLREERLAISARDAGIARLRSSQSLTWQRLQSDFADFWKHEDPQSVDSFREIAAIWQELRTKNSPVRQRIKGKYLETCAVIAEAMRKIADCREAFGAMFARLREMDAQASRIITFADGMRIDNFAEKKTQLEEQCEALAPLLGGFEESLNAELMPKINDVNAQAAVLRGIDMCALCPLEKLPSDFQKEIEGEVKEALGTGSLSQAIANVSAELARVSLGGDSDFAKSRNKLSNGVDKLRGVIKDARARADALGERAARLDSYKGDIDGAIGKAPGWLTPRPRKGDGIAFLTAVKIKAASNFDGYLLPLKGGKRVPVSAADLVYLGLAKYVA